MSVCVEPCIDVYFRSFLCLGDVGGQRTLRPYWRNYFEQTDAIVWVVDSGDRMRMQDCKDELHNLLLEDVSALFSRTFFCQLIIYCDSDLLAHRY
jgi:GTPase SAR1 family protein